MKLYSHHGLNDFVICCGYKGHLIKDYFVNLSYRLSDFTIDLRSGQMDVLRSGVDPWRVTLIDTGEKTMTGGRIKRIRDFIGDSTFCLTYGDGVSDVNIRELVDFHYSQGALATVTAVQLPGRFGALNLSADRPRVAGFREKSKLDGNMINGGFFVVEPEVFDLIDGDDTVWEQEPVHRLVAQDQLAVYHHGGYWQNMDTLRDQAILQELWDAGNPPWRVWDSQTNSASTDASLIPAAE
jgi:glucose-1-phosphate cytidylyltransferase